jgi:hypothetical protein
MIVDAWSTEKVEKDLLSETASYVVIVHYVSSERTPCADIIQTH